MTSGERCCPPEQQSLTPHWFFTSCIESKVNGEVKTCNSKYRIVLDRKCCQWSKGLTKNNSQLLCVHGFFKVICENKLNMLKILKPLKSFFIRTDTCAVTGMKCSTNYVYLYILVAPCIHTQRSKRFIYLNNCSIVCKNITFIFSRTSKVCGTAINTLEIDSLMLLFYWWQKVDVLFM